MNAARQEITRAKYFFVIHLRDVNQNNSPGKRCHVINFKKLTVSNCNTGDSNNISSVSISIVKKRFLYDKNGRNVPRRAR